jgi:hypothetical protein
MWKAGRGWGVYHIPMRVRKLNCLHMVTEIVCFCVGNLLLSPRIVRGHGNEGDKPREGWGNMPSPASQTSSFSTMTNLRRWRGSISPRPPICCGSNKRPQYDGGPFCVRRSVRQKRTKLKSSFRSVYLSHTNPIWFVSRLD